MRKYLTLLILPISFLVILIGLTLVSDHLIQKYDSKNIFALRSILRVGMLAMLVLFTAIVTPLMRRAFSKTDPPGQQHKKSLFLTLTMYGAGIILIAFYSLSGYSRGVKSSSNLILLPGIYIIFGIIAYATYRKK